MPGFFVCKRPLLAQSGHSEINLLIEVVNHSRQLADTLIMFRKLNSFTEYKYVDTGMPCSGLEKVWYVEIYISG